jgi:hypothetical protein
MKILVSYPGVDARKILKIDLKKQDVREWAGLNWLGIGTGGGLL